ncbi:cell division protein FtsZ [Roseomonas alkaliterrae]|uniref:Cell division protein FtsZ n=1 Tax=Neoroseomonas alkaliterrae TaxID=1452450 RepID=A0A840Y4A6_9PROT|nr:cell division protein FtsZ [Neoroseomonas alkaliterrae]MBB5688993.1 cell division protein FtsZ [Neoroseomonas alkaliterrae]MBR0674868.1 cell division protein FtsZ [Neoroseomonas alkaliterrae]
MTLNLTVPQSTHTDFSPRITVVGVGGGGTNAVNNMIAMGLDGVEFLVANTDSQSLFHSKAERRVQLGPHLTQGLGAGAKPEIGRAAAEEAMEELARHIEGVHMIFITAGMGGGTGTGAAPVIARLAREKGVLTVGVVTRPFDFEGPKRRKFAEAGIEELQQFVDTLIVIPNQNLFRLANERTTFQEAFKMADNVLYMGVRGVTDLMVNPGMVNLDFADIRTVMAEMGKAMMGTGEAEGEDRARKAAEAAISNPLLEDISMAGAKGVLINITGGYDMTLFEVDEAANRIRKEVDEDANIIFGTSVDEAMNGRVRVSVVATGIDVAAKEEAARPKLVAVGGGAPVAAVATQPIPAPVAAPRVAAAPVPNSFIRRAAEAAPGTAFQPLRQAVVETAPEPAMPAAEPAEAAVQPVAQVEAPVMMTPAAQPMEPAIPPLSRVAVPEAPRQGGGALRNLFQKATGLGIGGMMRRTLPEASPPAQQPHAAPALRVEPSVAAAPAVAPVRPGPRTAPQQDEMGLEIPAFLRRQSN